MTDYKEKYEQALERAKAFKSPYCQHAAEVIFPELRESEDERIRKELITFLERKQLIPTKTKNEWIAWLEKQGEKLTDEVKPKFKVGDWCIDNEDGTIFQIVKVLDNTYTYKTNEGEEYSCAHYSLEIDARLWTIQDAKDGDVLAIENEYFLFKEKKENTSPVVYISHCFSDSAGAFRVTNGRDCGEFHSIENGINICPATKEQRDLLFSKMKDVGYEWDAEKKELKKIEQSYYHDDGLYYAIDILEKTLGKVEGYQSDDGIIKHQTAIETVNALYHKKPTEWSEEDEDALDIAIRIIQNGGDDCAGILDSNKALNWLKSLKPH